MVIICKQRGVAKGISPVCDMATFNQGSGQEL